MGARTKQRVPVHAITSRPDFAKEMGFHGAKLPLPYGPSAGVEGIGRNVAFFKDWRDKSGPGFPLMADCYMAMDADYAAELTLRLTPCDLRGMEEPLMPDDYAARAKLEAWQARKDGLLNAIKKLASQDKPAIEADRRQLDMDIEHHQANRPIVPPGVTLFAEDSTAEAFALDLGLGWPSSSLWSDEGGLVIGGHAMSAGSVMRFLTLLNRLWDGNSFTRRRTTRDNVEIGGRRLTVSLMAQPNIVQELIGGHDGLARGIGLLARFLIC